MFSSKFLVIFALALILVVEAQPQSRDKDGSRPVRGKGGRRYGKGGRGKYLDFNYFVSNSILESLKSTISVEKCTL